MLKLSKVVRVLVTNETTFETPFIQVLEAEVNHCEIDIPKSFWLPFNNTFNFTHEVKKTCESIDNTVIVKSARSNFERRELMRKQLKDINFHGDVFFIVGQQRQNDSNETNAKIQNVRDEFLSNDIIFGNFIDTYNNLTLKSRSALSFFLDRCKSKNLFLIDDDVLIKYPAIFNNNFGLF